VALVGLFALPAFASTASAAPTLPDLVADAPGPSEQPEIYDDGTTQRLLMRLDGFVHNRGDGALEIRGSAPSAGSMSSVRQRIYDNAGAGVFTDRTSSAQLRFERADGHNHWHLMNAMRYSLWSSDRMLPVAPAQKVGFCLIDSERIESHGPSGPRYMTGDFCGQNQPGLASIAMGVSAGWRDIYHSGLAFQWVDISDTAPGSYWLRADADPNQVIAESHEDNVGTYAVGRSVVNGYLAAPVDAGSVPANRPSPIELRATRFDDPFPASPGPRQFRIVRAPSSGTLDKPTGEWFSQSRVHYTPSAGHNGPVSFTFAARDATSAFPRTPRTASVTLTVAAPSAPVPDTVPGAIAISGAPEVVHTSSVTPLTVTGPGAMGNVSWSVNSLVGGSPQLGQISVGGVYTAPAAPPPGGAVTIGARTAAGAVATVVVRIVQAPVPKPAPSLTPPVGDGRLSRLVLARQRRTLIATVVPGRYGRLRFVARRGNRRIGRCSMMAKAGVPATCSMKLSRKIAPTPFICKVPRTKGLKLPGVRVTVTLSYGGKQRAVRRARAR
jgi:hypothetical protein